MTDKEKFMEWLRNDLTQNNGKLSQEAYDKIADQAVLLDQAEILLRDVARARLGIGDDYAAWRSKLAEWLNHYDKATKP